MHKNARTFYIITLLFLFTGLIPQALAIHEQNRTTVLSSSFDQPDSMPSSELRNPLMGLPSTSTPPPTEAQTDSLGTESANELPPATTQLQDQTAIDTKQYEKYVNDLYGFSILYPSDWEVKEVLSWDEDMSESERESSIEDMKALDPAEPWKALDDVCFLPPETRIEGMRDPGPRLPGELCVSATTIQSEKFLDTNDMTVKTRKVHDLTPRDIAEEAFKYESRFVTGKLLSSNETTFGVGKYPAWRVDSTASVSSQQYGTVTDYNIGVYSVIGDKTYSINSWIRDLVVPEYLPIILNMINSFQIIDEQSLVKN